MTENELTQEQVKERLEAAALMIEEGKKLFKAIGLDYKAVAAVARNDMQAVSNSNIRQSTRPSAARMRRRGIAL